MVHDIHARFIISNSSFAEQYGDMSSDTPTHTRTDAHTHAHTAGVQLVGHNTATYVVYVEYKWCMLSIHSVPGVYGISGIC